MGSITKEVSAEATPDVVWDAIRGVGALHTRLVPGFVASTELVPGGRRVTFANGRTVVEPVVSCSDSLRRLVWNPQGCGVSAPARAVSMGGATPRVSVGAVRRWNRPAA
ncbi:MAG: hypothetical protein WAU49_20040 [Steroidobacteraceae bacterium]